MPFEEGTTDTATTTEIPELARYGAEWASLRARRLNVLIEGPVAATHAVLRLLQPHIGAPTVWKLPHERFELPSHAAGALILENVATLPAGDQARLLAHLDGRRSPTQIISTTERPLFALVARGLFDPALYYRLNLVLLRFNWSDEPGLPARDGEGAISQDRQMPEFTPPHVQIAPTAEPAS
jgi:hypothetical protein